MSEKNETQQSCTPYFSFHEKGLSIFIPVSDERQKKEVSSNVKEALGQDRWWAATFPKYDTGHHNNESKDAFVKIDFKAVFENKKSKYVIKMPDEMKKNFLSLFKDFSCFEVDQNTIYLDSSNLSEGVSFKKGGVTFEHSKSKGKNSPDSLEISKIEKQATLNEAIKNARESWEDRISISNFVTAVFILAVVVFFILYVTIPATLLLVGLVVFGVIAVIEIPLYVKYLSDYSKTFNPSDLTVDLTQIAKNIESYQLGPIRGAGFESRQALSKVILDQNKLQTDEESQSPKDPQTPTSNSL